MPRLTKVRKKEGQGPKWKWSKMAECFIVACYVGHQPGGSYRTLGFSFRCLYCFFYLGIKSAAGFIAAPAIGPKAKPSQITHVKFYKKKYCQRHYIHRHWLIWSLLRILHILQMKMRKLRSDPGQIKRNEGALTQSNNRTANKEPAWLMSLRSLFENLLEALNIIGNLLLHTGVDQL